MDSMGKLLKSTRRALQHRVATGQVAGRAPSLVAAAVRDGRVVWSGGHGFVGTGLDEPPSADTQYRIGSITKTFVAVLVMRLRDEGRLELTDRLKQHLPGAGGVPGVGRARIGELLAHTAGIASETPPPWWERAHGSVRPQIGDLFADDAAKLTAGRHFHYSNPGFAALGALVGHLRQASWLDVVRAEILQPLGMDRTTPMPEAPAAPGLAVHPWADLFLPEPTPDAVLMAPAGQLWSTIEDLAKFGTFLLEGADDVLAPATLAEMRQPASPPSSTSAGPTWAAGFGLGVQLARLNGRDLAGHGGSMPGFVASLWTSVDEQMVGICLANATSGPLVGAIAADMIDIVATAEPRIPTPWRPAQAVDPAALEITGVWYWGANPFSLRVRADDDLELNPLGTAGRASRFTPLDTSAGWRGLDGYYLGETLVPVRRADGTLSHLDVGGFVFTRQPYPSGADDDPVPGGVDPDGWRGRPG